MRSLLLCFALLPLVGYAATGGHPSAPSTSHVRYAREWPVQLSRPQAGAYRITLDAAVYEAARGRTLRDVQILDAEGHVVASAIYPATPVTATHRTVAIPWFVLPPQLVDGEGDWSVAVQRNAAGDVLSIQSARAAGTQPARRPTAWLLDRGQVPGRLQLLTIAWTDDTASFDLQYRLEGSDDLRHWRLLEPTLRLMQLHNGDRTLRTQPVHLDTRMRYLRLLPMQHRGAAPVPASFSGEVVEAAAADDWQWQSLGATGSTEHGYRYALQGRFPIRRLDVVMPTNSTARWAVSSGDTDEMYEGRVAWHTRVAGWDAWNLSTDQGAARSVPRMLAQRTNDRDWRLVAGAGAALTSPPELRLGWRPGHLVFLAQGPAPYVLVAGSVGTTPRHAALEPMLSALRARNGSAWQPLSATLGPGHERDGASAYEPAPSPRDWKNLLLWLVLVVGSLVVVGFALSLIRSRRTADPRP